MNISVQTQMNTLNSNPKRFEQYDISHSPLSQAYKIQLAVMNQGKIEEIEYRYDILLTKIQLHKAAIDAIPKGL